MTEPIREWAADRIGLRPGPYNPADLDWPTYGYDGGAPVNWTNDENDPQTAYTRADWLWLCDEMVSRWQAFRVAVELAPDETFTLPPEGA